MNDNESPLQNDSWDEKIVKQEISSSIKETKEGQQIIPGTKPKIKEIGFINKIASKWDKFWKQHQNTIGIMALGAFLTGIGVLVSLILSSSDRNGIEIISSPDEETLSGKKFTGIIVDVSGAVEKPGVYQLDENSRIADALTAAGGLSGNANRSWVSRYLNLAQPVTDGIKIYIPTQDETEINLQGQSGQVAGYSSNIINLNSASLSELDSLWGIGQSRAQAIIDNRPYSSIDELVSRKIIPANVLETNKDKLSL